MMSHLRGRDSDKIKCWVGREAGKDRSQSTEQSAQNGGVRRRVQILGDVDGPLDVGLSGRTGRESRAAAELLGELGPRHRALLTAREC